MLYVESITPESNKPVAHGLDLPGELWLPLTFLVSRF